MRTSMRATLLSLTALLAAGCAEPNTLVQVPLEDGDL
jgi:hypothetical protein